ncbi:MAG TPA: nitroreductase family protein [Blastocatellia bacterium]|nr:nitroreductase family protein [Blastocatellia bacterium]
MPTPDVTAVKRAMENLQSLITVLPVRLQAITNDQAAAKSTPESWSKKQKLGHLIDSAANNHQRIVRAQMEGGLDLPGYDGDRWVELHGYQTREWRELIDLWRAWNAQLLSAARSSPADAWSHAVTVAGDAQTAGFVMVDYVRHMAGHLRHIGVAIDDLLGSESTAASAQYPERPAPVNLPVNELMKRRWSPRAFQEDRAVEREQIFTILEAARWAPSCFNDQPRFFLVFDGSNPEALDRARECLAEGNAWALKAPVLMLSVARDTFEQNNKANRWAQHDTGLATENLLLEAVELGLAAHPMAGYDAERARSEFGIPDGFTPIAMIAIGYPYRGKLEDLDEKLRGKELASRTRKPIGEIAFDGTWGRPIRSL